MTETSPLASRPKKDRSPNYPALTFSDALERAKKIWDKDKCNQLALEMAAAHMGYKGKSGSALAAIGALKRYGLLERSGEELRVTKDANTIFIAPPDHPDRRDMVQKLAMLPSLFGEVLAKFPDGLPSDANLRYRLRKEWSFASDQAADSFIKALRNAIAIGGVAQAEEMEETDDSVILKDTRPMTQILPTAQAQAPLVPALKPLPPGYMPPQRMRSWDLGDGAIVSLSLPQRLSKSSFERLKRYLTVLEMEEQIAWETEQETPDGSES